MPANTMLVKFHNVGRRKLSWDVNTTDTTPTTIEELVRKKGALMSHDISAEYTEDQEGIIFAGIRPVGTFQIHSYS